MPDSINDCIAAANAIASDAVRITAARLDELYDAVRRADVAQESAIKAAEFSLSCALEEQHAKEVYAKANSHSERMLRLAERTVIRTAEMTASDEGRHRRRRRVRD